MTYSRVGETEAQQVESYEAPLLTPIGNLRDLLATGTGSQCDEAMVEGLGTDPDLCA